MEPTSARDSTSQTRLQSPLGLLSQTFRPGRNFLLSLLLHLQFCCPQSLLLPTTFQPLKIRRRTTPTASLPRLHFQLYAVPQARHRTLALPISTPKPSTIRPMNPLRVQKFLRRHHPQRRLSDTPTFAVSSVCTHQNRSPERQRHSSRSRRSNFHSQGTAACPWLKEGGCSVGQCGSTLQRIIQAPWVLPQ